MLLFIGNSRFSRFSQGSTNHGPSSILRPYVNRTSGSVIPDFSFIMANKSNFIRNWCRNCKLGRNSMGTTLSERLFGSLFQSLIEFWGNIHLSIIYINWCCPYCSSKLNGKLFQSAWRLENSCRAGPFTIAIILRGGLIMTAKIVIMGTKYYCNLDHRRDQIWLQCELRIGQYMIAIPF